MVEKISRLKTGVALVALLLLGTAFPVSATLIGPGIGSPGTLDDTGSGTFVDETAPSGLLAIGTYDVTLFEALFGIPTPDSPNPVVGVRPFLATTADGGLTYTTIWVGLDVAAPLSFGTSTNPYALGTQQFTLAAAESIFAGFQNTAIGASPISFTGTGSTDIDAPNLGDNITNVGDIVTANNQGLARTYDFGITVALAAVDEPIPAPATLALFGLGLAGLGFSRRRKV